MSEKAEKQFALGPDGRIVNFDPHHNVLKPGWRIATQGDIDALLAKYAATEVATEEIETEGSAPVIHESVVELTSE